MAPELYANVAGQSLQSVEEQSDRSEQPKDSQTASEFIDSQLQLEADAREALPFSFEHCTQPLGPLRQSVFSCITCNPPPSSNSDSYTPAGLCYACSIACHGEHTLVELFTRRDFTCDCGTIRLPAKAPCTLRINPSSGMKGPVHSQEPPQNNNYNHNFQNTFCGCGEVYDAHKEKGTMYQCIGLATEQDGGCGEDWWHPECLLGLPRDWYTTIKEEAEAESHSKPLSTRSNEVEQEAEHPVPPGFPDDDQFEALICYKCVNTSPWIKRYAGSNGFEAVVKQSNNASEAKDEMDDSTEAVATPSDQAPNPVSQFKKRKAADTDSGSDPASPKRAKISSGEDRPQEPLQAGTCRIASLPLEPKGTFSLVATTEKFRERFCRCPDCYTLLKTHPQLLEEEDIYEPPISEEGDNANGGGSVGTGSLLDRGEAALSNMDRVRAIEGVMAYNNLKDNLKSFLQPFAESGRAVSAEDIKAHFEKLRGDAEAIRAAGVAAASGGDGAGGSNRHEQSGY